MSHFATSAAGQGLIAALLLATIALATWAKLRHSARNATQQDLYLAGKSLTWPFVAGSITLTNLSTEQLVGMNGNQMLLLAWWEIAGFVGLLILAFVFVPLYYRNNCTTVTELLERRYGGRGIRTLISALFLFGNIVIYLPAGLYSGALFLQSMSGAAIPLVAFAAAMAIIAAAYTMLGGLKAVAVMDTYSGVLVLTIALLIVLLALQAINFDLSGIPPDRLTMVGDRTSPIPFHTLFTGMLFIQIFYWSTNQNITQKAMTAPTVREAQKGVLAAAGIRILIIPVIVTVPGVVAYKLMGDVDDRAYGLLVAQVLPPALSGLFAAAIAAAVIAHTAAILNSTVALWSVDFHERLFRPIRHQRRLAATLAALLTLSSVALVPLFANAKSIINLLQQLNGLFSMPILSAFVTGLLFRNVRAAAAIAGTLFGIAFYALATLAAPPNWLGLHYIDWMLVTLLASIAFALTTNRLALGQTATLRFRATDPSPRA
ncbi:sodium:solute symporter family transporter [Sandaracinobacteroides saxicola]|uniref:Sodium/solute symporter n=1 Tax=Sandaracinobacteroides saxicola TaxID=2759707 RepID=A0A7G5IJ00_9SPHN|nr:sodium/solute symporter [Sandaracinobacteroides saxicola]QMW23342.1 sodium/solute symporter [Sandaracinobacteroides saxicola]